MKPEHGIADRDIELRTSFLPSTPLAMLLLVGKDATYYVVDEEYNLQGQPLEVSDLWSGPHPGIPYVLEPGMRDIRYDSYPRPMVTKKVRLSSVAGADAAFMVTARIGVVKGWQGGRVYINEWKELFAPLTDAESLEYRYIGHLEDDAP